MVQIKRPILGAIFLLALASCAPSEVKFTDKNYSSDVSGAQITINNGSAFTNQRQVKVQIKSPNTTEMILSTDPECKSDQGYLPQLQETTRFLELPNSQNKIYAKFRNKYKFETDCVSAAILHDDVPPVVDWEEKPASETSSDSATLKSVANDNGSGIQELECKFEDDNYKKCPAKIEVRGLKNKRHKVQVRSKDRAGNYSEPISADWLVDTVGPAIEITSGPPALSNQRDLSFEFLGRDDGVGIHKYNCQLNGRKVEPCRSPVQLRNLSDGFYVFEVTATDRVGNVSSTPARYNFEVDQVPPGSFSILGVTSSDNKFKDNLIDAWLVSPSPKVHYTGAEAAQTYRAKILRLNGTEACASVDGSSTLAVFESRTCQLTDNTSYQAVVTAKDSAGNERSMTFQFAVDMSPPIILIGGPYSSADNLTAQFDFSVTDQSPGRLANATCFHSYRDKSRPIETQQSCDSIRSLIYTNLSYGPHEFKIRASDVVGNTSESQISWRVVRTICDPFADENVACSGGLMGEIFYLNKQQQQEFNKAEQRTVQFFFDNGEKVDAELNLSLLNVATRKFNEGFPSSEGGLIKNDEGENLIEYFAFKLSTVIKLDVDNEDPNKRNQPGLYQFATLSDDGSIMRVLRNGKWVEIINNDADHNTRLECAAETVLMDADTRLGAQVDYYQGPRDYIALNLIWRRVEATTSPEPLCGSYGDDFFFGPYPHNDLTNAFGWGKLLERGWRPLTSRNYISPKK